MEEDQEKKLEINPNLDKLLTNRNPISIDFIDRITDKIYLGGLEGATDLVFLSEEKITHVLSLLDWKIEVPKNLNITHKLINISDIESSNLFQYFKECIEFIESANKIYIHCMCGVSRSPSIVIAYLMWKTRCSLDDTYAFVLSRRIYIGPNDGFMEQLKFFDKLLKEKNYNLNEIDSCAFASGERKENEL